VVGAEKHKACRILEDQKGVFLSEVNADTNPVDCGPVQVQQPESLGKDPAGSVRELFGQNKRCVMADSNIAAVFFDLGDTLGSAVFSGSPPRLTGFDLFLYTLGIVADLKARGLKLGVISNTGTEKGPAINAVLTPTGLLAHFDTDLLVYSGDEPPLKDGTPVTKEIAEIFRRAAKRAGLEASPARNLFVGEDADERQVAVSAGWQVCPHPLLVGEMLAGQPLSGSV
jgi:bacterial leucyl aminopeptidase